MDQESELEESAQDGHDHAGLPRATESLGGIDPANNARDTDGVIASCQASDKNDIHCEVNVTEGKGKSPAAAGSLQGNTMSSEPSSEEGLMTSSSSPGRNNQNDTALSNGNSTQPLSQLSLGKPSHSDPNASEDTPEEDVSDDALYSVISKDPSKNQSSGDGSQLYSEVEKMRSRHGQPSGLQHHSACPSPDMDDYQTADESDQPSSTEPRTRHPQRMTPGTSSSATPSNLYPAYPPKTFHPHQPDSPLPSPCEKYRGNAISTERSHPDSGRRDSGPMANISLDDVQTQGMDNISLEGVSDRMNSTSFGGVPERKKNASFGDVPERMNSTALDGVPERMNSTSLGGVLEQGLDKTSLDQSKSLEVSSILSPSSYYGSAESGWRPLQRDSDSEDRSRSGSGSASCCTCFPLRYLVVAMVFVGMVIVNAMRTNVGVTVLIILDKNRHAFNNNTGRLRQIPHVDWDSRHIGYLHSIFYLGYMMTHLPAGYLTTRLPSHALFGGCILISCLLNLTLPVAIEAGGYGVTMAVRGLQGLSEGVLYPACFGIIRHWSTPQERGRVGSLVLTGAYLGPVLGFPLAGLITDYFGWMYIYYVNGGIGVVYALLWALLSEEKPAHHKKISLDELTFIENLQGSERIDYEGVKIPWCDILTSLPVTSLCLCNFAWNWVFILLLTNEPFFLQMFNFSITMTGAISALPPCFKMLASLSSGILADCLMGSHMLTTTHTRKLLTMGFGLQALFFVLLTTTTDGTIAMVFFTTAVGFGGFVVSGWQLNLYDLSPRHATVLMAVTSTFGNIGSVTAPILAGFLTESSTFRGWNGLWFITSGFAGLACFSFLVFGTGERQAWSYPSGNVQLVVKADSRRRDANPSFSSSSSPSKRPLPPTPVASFTKLREAREGHVRLGALVPGHVPNYGSQQTSTPGPKKGED